MVKKTSMEERQNATEERLEGLEQSFEGLTLANTELRNEFREWMERLEHRLPKRRRRKRASSSTVVNEEDGESENSTEESESASEQSSKPRRRYHGRKLEIPVFEGEEAYGWLVKVERYFKINGVDEDEMLEAVIIALDGRALNWYQWWEEQHPEPSWEEFKQAVIRRFQPGLVRNPLGPILNVKQTGTVMEYREQFEMLMAPLKRSERGMLESIFINGLREEIQTELKLHNTRGLNSLMDRALLIEERNRALRDDSETRSGVTKWKSNSSGSGYEPGRNRTFVTKPKSGVGSSSGGPMESKSAVGARIRSRG